ncbi:cupin domain-containing protein, partial [Rhodobacterales bacterium]
TEATERSGQEGRYTVLSGPGSAIAAIRLELKAGKSTKDAKHIGEEWLHVLAGDITLRVAGKDFSLGTGDSIHFDSSQVHRVTNEGRRAATVLVASTAATMPMHHPVPLPRTRR